MILPDSVARGSTASPSSASATETGHARAGAAEAMTRHGNARGSRRIGPRLHQQRQALDRIAEILEDGEVPLAVCSAATPAVLEELRHRQQATRDSRSRLMTQTLIRRHGSVLVATDKRILFTDRATPPSAGGDAPAVIRAFSWREVEVDVVPGPLKVQHPRPLSMTGKLRTWGLRLATPDGMHEFTDVIPPHKLRKVRRAYLRAHPETPKTNTPLPPSAGRLVGLLGASLAANVGLRLLLLPVVIAALVGIVLLLRSL